MRERNHDERDERGFVLVTSLVILMVLTIMLVGLYMRGKVNQDTSVSERDSTQAYYLAETGLNYIAWALYTNPASPSLNNSQDLDGANGADNLQLQNTPDQAASSAPLKYLDLNNKVGYITTNPSATTLSTVVNNMPSSHLVLTITLNSTGAPSVSPQNPYTGTGTPSADGAVVWLVPATLNTSSPQSENDSNNTSGNYALYAYSIGYVHGKALRVLRARIGTVSFGMPSTLGALTNGFNP